MALSSGLVAKLETPATDGKTSIGTAYPIAPGYIITAYHVFPDITDFAKTRVLWQRNDDIRQGKDSAVEKSIDEVVYKSSDYDLVIAACETPEEVIAVQWCREFSELSGAWSSTGYAATGRDSQIKKRLKDPAGGTFATAQDDDWIQQLVSEASPSDVELWRGMSGAAVFLKDTDRLAAVIVETPRLDKTGEPVRDNLLYAVSLPYVFKHSPKFRAAIDKVVEECGQAAYACFREQQFEAIEATLSVLTVGGKLHGLLANLLALGDMQPDHKLLCNTLFEQAEADPLTFLRRLRENVVTPLTGQIDHIDFLHAKALYLLFLGLLLSSEHFAFAGAVHDLQGKTRMAAELQLAGRYNKPPRLMRNPNVPTSHRDSVIGENAIDATFLSETGWVANKTAEAIVQIVDKSVYKTHAHVNRVKPGDTVYELDDFDIELLNEELLLRRERSDKPELIRLEVGSTKEIKEDSPLHDTDVCEAIQQKLSHLIIARYGNGVMSKEIKLLAETREFFNLIEGDMARVG